MYLAKASGGTTLNYLGKPYTWEADGDVLEVPDALGAQLLAIHGAGYTEIPPEEVKAAAEAEAKAAAGTKDTAKAGKSA
jgi:hypothetical protein